MLSPVFMQDERIIGRLSAKKSFFSSICSGITLTTSSITSICRSNASACRGAASACRGTASASASNASTGGNYFFFSACRSNFVQNFSIFLPFSLFVSEKLLNFVASTIPNNYLWNLNAYEKEVAKNSCRHFVNSIFACIKYFPDDQSNGLNGIIRFHMCMLIRETK